MRLVNDCTKIYRLCVGNNLNESSNKVVARYIGGLKNTTQDKLELNVVWSLSHAFNLALKVEQKLTQNFKNILVRHQVFQQAHDNSKFQANTSKITTPTLVAPPNQKHEEYKMNNKTTRFNKDNLYVRTTNLKCFMCF